ncbi:Superoxide_reductase [Hexamita inflata]|uniref:Superoxide reductase n=1 Tax=Hexamita inflata TaxID=28002 RepID=A0AA86NC13_9EUKA|nr:Superoxide reductase [Hexamita inflata]
MFKSIVIENRPTSKHIPFIEVDNNIVSIRCGKDAYHGMTDAHYEGWIKLYGLKNNILLELGTATYWPTLINPHVQFQLPDIKAFSKLVAVGYCNLHGLCESELVLQQ